MSGLEEGRPDWDAELARKLVGAIVLVGITYTDPEGNVDHHTARFGLVSAADSRHGIAIECHGNHAGETLLLPPVTEAFSKASRGRYELLSGDVVVDPDYLTTWTAQVLAGN